MTRLAPLEWPDLAACRGHEHPDMWYPPLPTMRPSPVAVAICRRRCEVRADCLEWALAHPAATVGGVWGGLTESQRVALKRQQRDAARRPRKPQLRPPCPSAARHRWNERHGEPHCEACHQAELDRQAGYRQAYKQRQQQGEEAA